MKWNFCYIFIQVKLCILQFPALEVSGTNVVGILRASALLTESNGL
jgi:hypothetical protein